MKINQAREVNFPKGYEYYLYHYKHMLYLVALISIILNTLSAPALGIKAVIIMVVACIAARESEYVFYYHIKGYGRSKTKEMFGDTMCYLDGLLIALLLPIGTPLYVVVIAVVFANYIVRNGFGGFTYNIFNVAAIGAVFATLSWNLIAIFDSNLVNIILENLFGLPKVVTQTLGNSVAHVDGTYNYLLLGNPQTTLGYIPAFIIILIAIFLMIKKVIDYKIVFTLVISTIVIGYCVNLGLNIDDYIIKNIFIGTFLFGTVFIASDPTVIPNTTFGKIFYSIIVVFIMFVMRELGAILDGFIFAVLFGNMLTPFINAKSAIMSVKRQIITGVVFVIIVIVGAIGIGNVASQKEPVENTLQWYNPTFVKPISESVIQGGVINE